MNHKISILSEGRKNKVYALYTFISFNKLLEMQTNLKLQKDQWLWERVESEKRVRGGLRRSIKRFYGIINMIIILIFGIYKCQNLSN